MYNSGDTLNLKEFKKRLKKARKKSGFSQKELADNLHLSRTTIVQWEGDSYNKIPTLWDFVKICSLLEVDPNYLLDKSNIDSNNVKAISDSIGLSYSNVKQLRNNKHTQHFIDFFLSSSKSQKVLYSIKQYCYYKFIYEAMETTFSPESLRKISKAFDNFYLNVSPLDMNVKGFEIYIKNEIPWKSQSFTIHEYIHSTITDNEYNNILFSYPEFETLTDNEKYDIFLRSIAETSYDYLSKRPIFDLSRLDTIKAFDSIVGDFTDAEYSKFKNRKKEI